MPILVPVPPKLNKPDGGDELLIKVDDDEGAGGDKGVVASAFVASMFGKVDFIIVMYGEMDDVLLKTEFISKRATSSVPGTSRSVTSNIGRPSTKRAIMLWLLSLVPPGVLVVVKNDFFDESLVELGQSDSLISSSLKILRFL